jgi:hypothetical protein
MSYRGRGSEFFESRPKRLGVSAMRHGCCKRLVQTWYKSCTKFLDRCDSLFQNGTDGLTKQDGGAVLQSEVRLVLNEKPGWKRGCKDSEGCQLA